MGYPELTETPEEIYNNWLNRTLTKYPNIPYGWIYYFTKNKDNTKMELFNRFAITTKSEDKECNIERITDIITNPNNDYLCFADTKLGKHIIKNISFTTKTKE